MLLSVSVPFFSVIAFCAPTLSNGKLLDVEKTGRYNTPVHERKNVMNNKPVMCRNTLHR